MSKVLEVNAVRDIEVVCYVGCDSSWNAGTTGRGMRLPLCLLCKLLICVVCFTDTHNMLGDLVAE